MRWSHLPHLTGCITSPELSSRRLARWRGLGRCRVHSRQRRLWLARARWTHSPCLFLWLVVYKRIDTLDGSSRRQTIDSFLRHRRSFCVLLGTCWLYQFPGSGAAKGTSDGANSAADKHADRPGHCRTYGRTRGSPRHETATHQGRIGFALRLFSRQGILRCRRGVLGWDAVAGTCLFREIGVRCGLRSVGRGRVHEKLLFRSCSQAECLLQFRCKDALHAVAPSRGLQSCQTARNRGNWIDSGQFARANDRTGNR
ncbi:hypothetical protein SAMN05192589_101455 [Paracidovorax valerianellae]|uniref:Uncharacterized protein n=1 Tax=Paracidovorax valerianellae TaxID=187868 RepID=A0A1G6JQR1_9BURK|nr:hypothetical protein SAMN05192589_101455 [Paracidovorax valerianellae]